MESLPTLKELHFGELQPSNEFYDNTQRNTQLHTLHLRGSNSLTNDQLIALLPKCPSLIDQFTNLLTNRTVWALLEHCPHLSKLYFAGHRGIDDVGVVAIARTLKERSLNGPFTDRAVTEITEHCRNIHSLTLYVCRMATTRLFSL